MEKTVKYFDYTTKEGCIKALDFYKIMVEKYEDVINHFESTMKHFKFPEKRFRTQELEDSYKYLNPFKRKVEELKKLIKEDKFE